ncbi:MAG: 5-formyltetrahydrofolate cyclo-ligase [Planctomycetes bacterium]|nr:5-formyltetrahydrofolate cyclo-ligase [Planctomycetota bacterium]
MSKKQLRKQIQDRVRAMSSDEKRGASQSICSQLSSIASVTQADSIFTFLPLVDEVDLRSLIALWIDESRTICVPLVNWETKTMRGGLLTSLDQGALVETRHGILEPKAKHALPSDSIDVVLVPGVGFDASGGRLGRGGGYYDRFLANARPPIVIGVCFEQQIVRAVPREAHDQCMSAVVTPTNVLVE